MLANLCSWSRIAGTSKNGKEYDFIVLHCSVPRSVVQSPKCIISGFPVEFRDVKIPFAKWHSVTGLDGDGTCLDDFLSDHVGEAVELSYNVTTYNGVDRAFISKVEF